MITIDRTSEKIVGLKQTLRAIQQNKVRSVYLANDTEEHIVRKITEVCSEKSIALIPTDMSKKELGRFCQIEVGTAILALLK